MNFAMTRFAKRDPISDIKSCFGVFRKRANMVRVQVAALGISAMLAREIVTQKNIEAPTFIFRRKALAAPLSKLSILVRVTGYASRHFIRCAARRAYFRPLLRCSANPFALTGFSLIRFTDGLFRCFRMCTSFECGRAAFRAYSLFNAATGEAMRRPSITAILVEAEIANRFPRFTLSTPFLTSFNPGNVLLEMESYSLSSNLQNTESASHSSFLYSWSRPLNYTRQTNRETEMDRTKPDSYLLMRVGKHAAGRLLDGREWNEFPKTERVRA